MDTRGATASTTLLMALMLTAVALPGAFAQSQGMAITATAGQGSDTITITGKTSSDRTDVTFTVTSPSLTNRVGFDQVTPDANGEFQTIFKIGPTWTEDGFYEIEAKQGSAALYNLRILVEIRDGAAVQTSVTESNLPTGILGGGPNVAVDRGLSMESDAVYGSTSIMITGTTDRLREDITLTVTTPNGNVVSADQISPDTDGTFSAVITTGGPLWSQDGIYMVTGQQNDNPLYKATAEVDIKDGIVIPEFGIIAVLVLAVAVISVVAISSRSRLGITPGY